ncbi:MAG: PA0069 family radical SAM protein, partial [Acetobacteraceae bacterium]|nr:PA0069 family radical SAM protein [Acetobacteraceae bacterium]
MPDGAQLTRELDGEALFALTRSDQFEPAPEGVLRSLRQPGRGAVTNPALRYETTHTEAVEDGWSAQTGAETPPPLQTTLHRDRSKAAISWNDSPDLGFDRSVNPYRGCEHGCIYCYARPSHAYLGYSPGLDFETELVYKPEVASLLERELSRPGYRPGTLVLGSNTDPYQPVERTLRLTRSVLEVLERFGHPVSIVTKSATVCGDIDILRRMAGRGLVRVHLSVTTLEGTLARRMEPRAAAPALRLRAIAELAEAGIPVGVLAAPMIPGLNDAELETIVAAAHKAGATAANYVLLRLPLELRDLFTAWLHEHMPDRARRILALIRETRAGALNDSQFHDRFRGTGPYADLLRQRFARICRQCGLGDRQPLETAHFSVPSGT